MRTWVLSLALLSGLRIRHCSDLPRIWPCCGRDVGPAAAALIQPLASELPFATGVALKQTEKEKKKKLSFTESRLEHQAQNGTFSVAFRPKLNLEL